MTKRWYVELSKTVYSGGEVEADSAEEAEDKYLLEAEGNPLDWKVVMVQPGAEGFKVEPGGMTRD